MGTTLTGTQIQNTYDGLIKTTDNTALSATTKLISDGLGNDSCIKVGTAGTDFLGNVDFSAATVTGLPGGAAGLESGTGTDSMQSAASLTTVGANAVQPDSIAIGCGAQTPGTLGVGGIAIGKGSCIGNYDGTAVGYNAKSTSNGQVFGVGSCVYGNQGVALGFSACATGAATALGHQAKALAAGSIAIGGGCTNAFASRSIAIGCSSCATASCAVALGQGVTAATADTVSVKALETQTASTPTAGGIIMTDAGSVARRLNIDAAGTLQIDSTPVGGGGGAAGLVAGTGTDSMQSAASLTTVAANASGTCAIALGDGAIGAGTDSIGIGRLSCGNNYGVALGYNAKASGYSFSPNFGDVTIGANALSTATGSIAIGACARNNAQYGIAIGQQSCNANASVDNIVIGPGACASSAASRAIVIGCNISVTAVCAVALNTNATRANTVAGQQFESTTVGKGIVVTSPDGLTTLGIGIDNTGAIVTYTP